MSIRKLSFLSLILATGFALPAASQPIISGVFDGPLTGGTPKAIEIHFPDAMADISSCGVGSANNGGGSDGEEFTFPAVAVNAGDTIHVAAESPDFMTYFGFAPDYTDDAANINGDDAIELFCNGGVVDVFGDINTDGSGQPWDHLDGWAYRTSMTGPDGSTFVIGNWSFSGINAVDGCPDNDSCNSMFPIGTFLAGEPVDNPPTVTGTNPSDMDTDVATTTSISISFSESVSTSDGAFAIDCGTPQNFTSQPADLSNVDVVTLSPDAALPASTQCTVTVTGSGVADLDGMTQDQMVADFVFGFTTAAPDTTAPQVLSVTRPTAGPTSTSTLTFAVSFDEAVAGFDMADVTVNHTGTSAMMIEVQGSGASYDAVISGIAGDGNLSVTVDATGVVDLSGNVGTNMLTSDSVIIAPPGEYYANVDDSNAAVLRTTLHDTIDDHTKFPYSSGSGTDTWDILEMGDEDPNNANQILTVYENSTYTKGIDRNQGSGSDNFNREHVWPRGTGLRQDFGNDSIAAVDTHNLRLSYTQYNSDRQSKWFDDCNASCSERATETNDGVGGMMSGMYPGDSNWLTSGDGSSGTWEVWEDRRGDIARSMFYMDVRYEGGSHSGTSETEPELILTSDRQQSGSGTTYYFGNLATLIQWHEDDPIDQKELDRNEIVFNFQGNRNPFVDHPEWVDILYGNVSTCQLNIASPANQSSFEPGMNISFSLDTSDPCYNVSSLTWSSSIDNMIGSGESFMAMLSNGVHTITVSGTDNDGAPVSASISVTVADTTNVEIFAIQGNGYQSPFVGQTVTTRDNIVTAVGNGTFAMQTPDARADGDFDTSNGIVVFAGGATLPAVGDSVDVTGNVVEFFGLTEFESPNLIITVNSSGNALPTAVVYDDNFPSSDPASPSCVVTGSPIDGESPNFECMEGMLIAIPVGITTSGNQSDFNNTQIREPWANAGIARAKREPGIEFPGETGLPVFDGNPEVFELDVDRFSGDNLLIAGGTTYSATGVLGFGFNDYQIWTTEFTVVNENELPGSIRDAVAGEYRIGSLNMFRLFDDMDDGDPNTTDEQITPTMEYQDRLGRFSDYIRNTLQSPDILAVQEVDGLPALQDLAARIVAEDATVNYAAHLIQGQDLGGIDVGYLVRDNVTVNNVEQLGEELESSPGDPLHDRPPLLLEANVTVGGSTVSIKVLNVHNRSFSGIDGGDAERVRTKRLEQAQTIAGFVQTEQTETPDVPLLVVGDFNDYEFSDGYVDAVGLIKGDFDPTQAERSGNDVVSPNLINAVETLPESERYSFVFGANAQVLDHALLSTAADTFFVEMQYGRGNADAPGALRSDHTTTVGISDHDGFVVFMSASLPDSIFSDGFESD